LFRLASNACIAYIASSLGCRTPAEEHTVAAVRDMFVEGMYFWPPGKKPQQMTAFDYKRWVRMGGIVQVNAILQASRLRE